MRACTRPAQVRTPTRAWPNSRAHCSPRAIRSSSTRLFSSAASGFLIAACTAPAATLRARVAAREGEARDASEAGLAVLEHQFASQEALAQDEARHVMTIDAARGAGTPEAAALALRLGLESV